MPADDGGAAAARGGVAVLQDGRAPHAHGQGQDKAEGRQEGEEGEAQAGVQAILGKEEQVIWALLCYMGPGERLVVDWKG